MASTEHELRRDLAGTCKGLHEAQHTITSAGIDAKYALDQLYGVLAGLDRDSMAGDRAARAVDALKRIIDNCK